MLRRGASFAPGSNALSVSLNDPVSVATVPGNRGLVFADLANHRVLFVNRSGDLYSLAGSISESCSNYDGTNCGDGGNAASATLGIPAGVDVARINGVDWVYVSDPGTVSVRKFTLSVANGVPAVGAMTHVAGNGQTCPSGCGTTATSAASFVNPGAISVDDSGSVLIADWWEDTVRLISSAETQVITVAGTGPSSPTNTPDGTWLQPPR